MEEVKNEGGEGSKKINKVKMMHYRQGKKVVLGIPLNRGSTTLSKRRTQRNSDRCINIVFWCKLDSKLMNFLGTLLWRKERWLCLS